MKAATEYVVRITLLPYNAVAWLPRPGLTSCLDVSSAKRFSNPERAAEEGESAGVYLAERASIEGRPYRFFVVDVLDVSVCQNSTS